MNQHVIDALAATFIGDNEKLKEAHTILSEFAMQPGFCITLMEIVDE